MEVHITEARVYKDLNDITRAKVPSVIPCYVVIAHSMQDGSLFHLCGRSHTSRNRCSLGHHLCVIRAGEWLVELPARLPNGVFLLLWGLRCIHTAERPSLCVRLEVYGSYADPLWEGTCGWREWGLAFRNASDFQQSCGDRQLVWRFGRAEAGFWRVYEARSEHADEHLERNIHVWLS